MARIQILPDFIANQIAAGEVVQRPASVVKELIENSIDAGADAIALVVKDAGKKLIHIVDNGSGMSKDDLELSVKRHATSKIIEQEDLEHILTFGFRGEALASISSVALVEIRTKQNDDKVGWQLIAEPNKDVIINPMGTDNGTQVIVKNLFYNVPARRKFLRTNLTEFRHISDVMIKFALSYPDKRFTFYDDDTLIFDVKPGKLEIRIDEVLGRDTVSAMMKIDENYFSDEEIKISGFVGQPQIARQSKSGQYLFLNKRSIVSKSLSHAVFSAFDQLLEKNQQPSFIINIELDPGQVDVNVHPQKNEVKFENERYVYNLIKKAVKETLKKYSLIPNINLDLDDSQSPLESFNYNESKNNDDLMIVNKMTGEIIESKSSKPPVNDKKSFDLFNDEFQKSNIHRKDDFTNENELSAFDELFGIKKQETANKEFVFQSTEKYLQVHSKYIINESEDGIIIIDQHNAHERILYERAIKAMNKEFNYSQQMLFPAQIDLSPSYLTLFKELESDLKNLGFDFQIKDNKIDLTSVPKDIASGEEKNSIIELIEQFEEYQEIRHTDKRDNIAASYSCKSAIKTGKKMSYDEMKKLKEDLFKCSMPYVCPHGRPVLLEFKIPELDKKFGRAKDLRFF